MGLADWWLARSEPKATDKSKIGAPAAPSSLFKWPLKRVQSEPRKSLHQTPLTLQAVTALKTPQPSQLPEPVVVEAARAPSRLVSLKNLSASVNQAKGLLQQCVSLYPSLVHLTVPSGNKDQDKPVVDDVDNEPVPEPEPTAPSWVASETLCAFENDVLSLAANHSLDMRMTSDGCGGVYFLQNTSSSGTTPFAIFKPRDEEYMAPKNPRGYVKENAIVGETEHPVNKGFRVGNGALRERAAYLLDETYGNFSGVPVTSLLSLPLKDGEVKEGSVQAFVESECSAEDMGPLKFSVPEVHKVGILDVRLFNTDRHAGNILLHNRSRSSSTYEMTPIDHGFCLPSYKHLDNANFDWLQWPQAQFPFTCEELHHIASLDADRDADLLRSLSFEEECVTTMRICTAVLKIGAEQGFSLFEIGSLLQRDGDFSQPSTLEKMVADAESVVQSSIDQGSVEFDDALVEEVERAAYALFSKQQPKKKVRSISCFS